MQTLTYVYADQTAVLGPLSTFAEPHAYDLCDLHGERLSAPRGWEVVRLAFDPAGSGPTEDDLLVLYLSGPVDEALVGRLEQAGGRRIAQDAYWDRWGVAVADPDGYRLVLSTRAWSNNS